MTRIVVDKTIYHAKPHSICFLPQYQRNEIFVLTIDLFRLYILFSQYRSRDDTREIWSFVLFIKKSTCRHIHACFNEQDKGSNLRSIITWSVLGKQNVQAKKVYWTHRLGFESARVALCKWAACTRQTLSKTFANSLNMQKQFEKMLGKRVMTRTRYRWEDIPRKATFWFIFYHNINVKEKFFFSERELKKALRDTLTRAAW